MSKRTLGMLGLTVLLVAGLSAVATAVVVRRPFNGSAQVMSAVVRSDGTLARGYGVSSSAKCEGSDGCYAVKFKRDVTRCTYSASIGSPDDKPLGGTMSGQVIVSRGLTTKMVGVATLQDGGTFADSGFHLIVACPPG